MKKGRKNFREEKKDLANSKRNILDIQKSDATLELFPARKR